MNWESWIVANKDNLKHVAGFEEQFVRSVLTKIEEIEPADVKTQYHFKDSKGGNRYIDFMIINEAKGFLLPIELDGIWKVQTYHEFDDMLNRQNALLRKYGVLLRYTNKLMLNNPNQIIEEIKYTLRLQSSNQLTKEIVDNQTAKRIEDYQKELETIKKQQADQIVRDFENQKHSEASLTKDDLAALQTTILSLQDKVDKVTSVPPIESVPPIPVAMVHQPHYENSSFVTEQPPALPTKSKLTLNHMIGIGVTSLIVTALSANAYFGKLASEQSIDSQLISLYDESVDFKDDRSISSAIDTDEQSKTIEAAENNRVNNSVEETVVEATPISKHEPTISVAVAKENESIDESEVTVIDDSSTRYQQPDKTNSESDISDNIPASQAKNHIGSYSRVCGNIAQVKKFSKGTYLNFGAVYPKQEATGVVWDSDKNNFGNLNQYEGKSVCIEGTIDTYKGKPQIKLASADKIT